MDMFLTVAFQKMESLTISGKIVVFFTIDHHCYTISGNTKIFIPDIVDMFIINTMLGHFGICNGLQVFPDIILHKRDRIDSNRFFRFLKAGQDSNMVFYCVFCCIGL